MNIQLLQLLTEYIKYSLYMESTLKFYQSFILDPNLLANGYALIKAFLLQSQTNRSNTFLNLLSSSPPILTLIGNVYPCDVFPYLDQQQKQKTRIFLIQTLWQIMNKNGLKTKQTNNLLSMIKKIHNQQGYDKWLSLYAQIISNIANQQFGQFIIHILQHADNRISTLSINIYSFVMNKISNSADLYLPVQTILQIFYYCIRSFSYLCNVDVDLFQQHYNPYEKYLINLLWNNINNNTICMKYVLKILTILYGDMHRLQEQDNQQQMNRVNILIQIGGQLVGKYLEIIQDQCYGGLIDQDQQDCYVQAIEVHNTKLQLYQNLAIILYQYLQLFSILIPALEQLQPQSSNLQKPSCIPIIIYSLLLTLPSRVQLSYWLDNSDQYFISIQAQYQKNLRNRSISMICNLIQQSQNSKRYLKIVQQYFAIVGQAVLSQPNTGITLVQNYLNTKLETAKISLSNTSLTNIQQSSYFILTSTISNLFPSSQLPSLLHYLSKRYNSSSSILIKIIILYTIINQLGNQSVHSIQNQLYNFILENINKENCMYSGLVLVLARGLGKICTKAIIKIQIGANVSIKFIQIMIGYISKTQQTSKPDEDGTYIILQVLLKLTENHTNNKNILANYITPQLQNFMMNNYMHDGLLSTIVLRIFQLYPYQQTVNHLASILLSGHITQQKYTVLIANFLKSSLLTLNQQHIYLLLQLYKAKLSIISPIILLYLSTLYKNKSKPSANIIQLLNNNYDEIWLVPMLRCGILENQLECIGKCLHNIVQEIVSQYQLQRKMLVMFYLAIADTQKFIGLLKNYKIYDKFINKIVMYAKLFQGQNLRTITSLYLLKLLQHDHNLAQKIYDVINTYGKLQISQWQDEQIQQQQQDQIQKLMNYKLQNDVLQKQLQELFVDLLNQNSAAYIQKCKNQLKVKLDK